MRIERNNIRMGLAGAKSNWEKNQLSQRKKLFAKLRKMNATTEKAKELVFLPLEVDHDYFDIPHIYYCERNPIVEYTDGSFHFSVISLKEKLKNKGNSIHNLTTSINEYTKGTVSLKYKESHDLYNGDRWTDIIRIHNRIEKYISTLNCTECIISADGADVRTIRIYSEIRNWTLVWVLETIYEGTSYSFILDNKQYSQYALNQYFTKVDEYGRLWNNLVRCFQFEFTKYSKLQTKKII